MKKFYWFFRLLSRHSAFSLRRKQKPASQEEKVVVNFWHTFTTGVRVIQSMPLLKFNSTIGAEEGIEALRHIGGLQRCSGKVLSAITANGEIHGSFSVRDQTISLYMGRGHSC